MSRSRLSTPALRLRPFGATLSRLRPLGVLITVLLLAATPASAYIVFLKDGSQIQTKEKYRIEGDKAILILPSGTSASYDASEIDIEKTEEINVVDYGTATLIEGLNKQKRLTKDHKFKKEPEFGQYISGRSLALPEVRKRAETVPEDQLPTTRAGFVDLMAFRRAPYPSAEVTGEVLGYLKGQGIDRVRIFKGTEPDRPLIEIVAASEASVFKAIKDSANSLAQIHENFPELVTAFELVLMTESQDRAGQFVLTPELADLLVKDQISVSQFFLRFVEF